MVFTLSDGDSCDPLVRHTHRGRSSGQLSAAAADIAAFVDAASNRWSGGQGNGEHEYGDRDRALEQDEEAALTERGCLHERLFEQRWASSLMQGVREGLGSTRVMHQP